MNKERKLNIVLAGQANVGKSVTFNHLTGLHQHIGNWPGKTIEKAEGDLNYRGYSINVLDLPGIYSFSTYSLEELVSREYIVSHKPDFIVNIVDATRLERNLIFTLQILELENPTVLALNMTNLLKEKGIKINFEKLEKILKIPVVPEDALHRKGITKILDRGIELVNQKSALESLKYGQEVEEKIKLLITFLKNIKLPYPKRWLAIKLLERDKKIKELVKNERPEILEKAEKLCLALEKIHGHSSSIVIADERCHLASRITNEVMKITKSQKLSWNERLDKLTCHKFWGYPAMIIILGTVFLSIFLFGNWFSSLLENIFHSWQFGFQHIFGTSFLASLAWAGVESFLALIEIVLPYILPFYLLLFLLEDWGYLARVAFLLDSFMHKMGIHGKASIPLVMGLGCNVPACLSCRIMETQRERFITGFLVTLVPCSAVTVIVMGLVGKFVGLSWAFGLYFLAVLIIFVMGKIASKVLPGKPTELIMEMPDYKKPSLKTVSLQTWFRLREFIYIAGPLIIIAGIFIALLSQAGWLTVISSFLSPVTVKWLGLPMLTGVLLIFGILRKELILLMLATLFGTTNFALVLTQTQMIVLGLVSMFYIPCIATIAALWKEFGWKKTLGVTVFEIIFAITLGGIAFRLLTLIK